MARITQGMNPGGLKDNAAGQRKAFKKLVKKLQKMPSGKLDLMVHQMHDDKFREAHCMECANCCRTISPIILWQDILRISKYLKEKPSRVMDRYFMRDEEGDFVFKGQPCPFLGSDNYCSIYPQRPRACRDFPLTDRPRFYKTLNVSLKNTAICPVVYEIFQDLHQQLS